MSKSICGFQWKPGSSGSLGVKVLDDVILPSCGKENKLHLQVNDKDKKHQRRVAIVLIHLYYSSIRPFVCFLFVFFFYEARQEQKSRMGGLAHCTLLHCTAFRCFLQGHRGQWCQHSNSCSKLMFSDWICSLESCLE